MQQQQKQLLQRHQQQVLQHLQYQEEQQQQHQYPWPRSRSTSDLHHQQLPPRVLPPRNEFYRISRRKIIGTAIRAEQKLNRKENDNVQGEHHEEAYEDHEHGHGRESEDLEGQKHRRQHKHDPNDGSSYPDSPPSDEGIYLQSSGSNSDNSTDSRRKNLSRHRSADPIMKAGWVPVFPLDVMKAVADAAFDRRCAADVSGRILLSEDEAIGGGGGVNDAEMKHRLRIPVGHPKYCPCVDKKHRLTHPHQHLNHSTSDLSSAGGIENRRKHAGGSRSSSSGGGGQLLQSVSQMDLTSYGSPPSSSQHKEAINRKVSELRLEKIASYHHLPRLPTVKPPPPSHHHQHHHLHPRLHPSARRAASLDPQKNNNHHNNSSSSSSSGSNSGKIFAKNKRQRNRTQTVGIQDIFQAADELRMEEGEEEDDEEEEEPRKESTNSSSGSDPGICLQFPSETTTGSSDDSDRGNKDEDEEEEEEDDDDDEEIEVEDFDSLSDSDSLEINLKLFREGRDLEDDDEVVEDVKAASEEAISLAFVQESATVHSYIASRGQREREQEIYEVLPPTITLKSMSKKNLREDISSGAGGGKSRTWRRKRDVARVYQQ